MSQDLDQDTARSSYADMVHDDERNRAYNEAIRVSVASLVNSREHNPNGDRYFNCCDIGTGSGLLSMMVVRAFLEHDYKLFHVKAFECFQPMANCAHNIIDSNSMTDYITVIPQRAELTSEETKFDLLVAELLDTELIGEGCIDVYQYAVAALCSPTCLFVPYMARIYVEPVASSLLFQRHAIDDLVYILDDGKKVIVDVDDEIKNCPGIPAIDDMQVSALREGIDFHRFSEPKVVFEFTFNDCNSLRPYRTNEVKFPIKKKLEQPPVLVMWWDIIMCDKFLNSFEAGDSTLNNDHILSCAPVWARTEAQLAADKIIREIYGRDVWREHWIQGIYYFPEIQMARKLVNLSENENLTIHAHHDTHSLWFSLKSQWVSPRKNGLNSRTPQPPACTCGVHRDLNRYQLAFLSCQDEMKKLLGATVHGLKTGKTILGRFQFRRGPQNHSCGASMDQLAPRWRIALSTLAAEPLNKFVMDLSLQDLVCWDKMLYKFIARRPLESLDYFEIKCTQVHFDNLCRIKMDVGDCEGFHLYHLDHMINSSSKKVDKAVEPHHLWQYSGKRLDNDHLIFSSEVGDFQDTREKIARGTYWKQLKLPLKYPAEWLKKGWALVFWAEFTMRHTGKVISTGPIGESKIYECIRWNMLSNQLVHFLHDHPTKKSTGGQLSVVVLDVGLLARTDHIELQVQRAVDYNSPPRGNNQINEMSST